MKNLLLKRWLFLIALFLPPAFMYGTGFPGPGAGTQANPYQIETLEHLRYLSEHSAYWSAGTYFIQTADIDASATSTWNSNGAGGYYGFSPIGTTFANTFKGNYNGQNHSIAGLFINRPTTDFSGLFGALQGVLQNLKIIDVEITGKNHVGGAIGFFFNATVTNCVVTGSVTGIDNVGGFVGWSYTDGNPYQISECYTSGTVSGVTAVGGFIGNQYIFDIENSFSLCNVTRISGTALNIGAFCGEIGGQGLPANPTHPIVKNCYATGTVYSSPTNVWGNGDGLTANVGFIGVISGYYGGATYDNFFDSQTTQQALANGATAKTTAEMKTQTTFTNWDFATIWNLSSGINDGYPAFQWMGPTLPSNPGAFLASVNSNSQIDCSWILNSNTDPVLLAFNTANTFGNPTGTYLASDPITGGGTVVYVGSNLLYNHASLSANTHYYYKIWSKDGADVYSNGATDDEWTLANVPSAPTVNNPTATTLDIEVNANGNPDATEFALHETTQNKFLQADGTLGATIVWQTAATWGTKTLTGLTTGTTYIFEVKARNGGNTETLYGATANGTPMLIPSVEYPTSGSADWSETQPAGDVNKSWYIASSSSDGSKMLTGAYMGRLYNSNNGGTNWTETQPAGSNDINWRTGAVSSDGSKMLAAANTGRLYMSTNGGSTWNEVRPAGDIAGDSDVAWIAAGMSSDGNTLLAAINNAYIYRSVDAGATWSRTGPSPDDAKCWISVSVSSDGSKMVAASYIGGRIYISTNSGETWTETGPTIGTNKFWYTVSISSDGSKILAGVNGGGIFRSTDGGSIWNQIYPAGVANKNWVSTSISADGNTMLAGIYGGRLYLSTDSGTNWNETQPAGDVDKYWIPFSLSSDGSKRLANSGSRLYRYGSQQTTVTDITATTATGNGKIADLNGGGNASNRGIVYYPFTNTDKIISGTDVTNVSENGSFGTGDFTASFIGLTPNTHYNARAHATNTVGIAYSDRCDFWTLANVPSAPTVDNPTATTLDVEVNVNGNPSGTEFAIYETTQSKYVQADGTLGASAVWQTATTWGAKTVTSLSTGTTYTFEVKARNGGNTETLFGATANGTPASEPTVEFATSGETWVSSGPTPASNKAWQMVSVSSDNNKIFAGVSGGRLYLSSDATNTWSETGPLPFSNKDWYAGAASSDGSKVVACVYGGRLYLSPDGGVSWSETKPAGDADKNWGTVSISSNGSKILAGIDNGRLWISSDGGTNWTESTPAGNSNQYWRASAMSSDGSIILAGNQNRRLYKSSDGGATWSEVGPTPLSNKTWFSISMSADGSKMLAAVYNDRLYMSSNSGTDWVETGPQPFANLIWKSVSVSADGNTMLAGAENGRLYQSVNGGNEWTEVQPAGNFNQRWNAVSVSPDASLMFAAKNTGYLYKKLNQVIKVTDIAATTATGNGKIANLNGGGNATNRGVIYYPYTGTNKVIGDANVTNVSDNGSFGTGNFTSSLTGLAVNTRYNLRAHATNTVGTGYSDTTDFWTLANVPDAPTVDGATATTLDVTVNENTNPNTTEYVIHVTSTGLNKFVQANGTLGATAVWATATTWGTKTVTGLTTGTEYTFEVKARNGINTETAYGSGTSANTCANPTDGGDIGSDQSICTGTTPDALTSISAASNYGGTLEYKWQSSITSAKADFNDIASSNAATYAPGTLTQTTWYKRLARVDCKANWTDAAESNTITVTVNSYETPSVSIAQTTGTNPCCPPDLVTLTATPVNGGLNPTYEWFKNGISVASTASYTFNPLDGDAVYVVMTTSLQCHTALSATSNTITMQVTVPAIVSVSVRATRAPGGQVKFTAYPVNGGATPGYQWYKNGTPIPGATDAELISTCQAGDEHWVVLTSSLPCTTPATSGGMCTY
jgi:photosystem II stability/assembly factor-like uncharacterized protein